MTGYDSGTAGLTAKAVDFFRLRGRLEASPFHFINLGVLAYIGMGQVRFLLAWKTKILRRLESFLLVSFDHAIACSLGAGDFQASRESYRVPRFIQDTSELRCAQAVCTGRKAAGEASDQVSFQIFPVLLKSHCCSSGPQTGLPFSVVLPWILAASHFQATQRIYPVRH